jgi:hypothetical protein
MQMAAMVKSKDIDRVEVQLDLIDPPWYMVHIDKYASNPAAKAENTPKRK